MERNLQVRKQASLQPPFSSKVLVIYHVVFAERCCMCHYLFVETILDKEKDYVAEWTNPGHESWDKESTT